MRRLLKKLEKRIEELRQEESTGVMHTCDFLSEDTLRARKELLRKLESKRDKLLNGTTEVSCMADVQTPTRVELMDAWNHLFFGAMVITWCCIAIACRREGASAIFSTILSGSMVVVAWLPGFVAMGLYRLFDQALSKLHPLYQAPRPLMNCHYREIKERLNHLSKPGEAAKDLSLALCTVIMLGNIASFIYSEFLWLSNLFGFFLSIGGLLVFGVILSVDLVVACFRKCKLWVSISYDLRQVF